MSAPEQASRAPSPPSYETVESLAPKDQLPTGELPSPVLDGTHVFHSEPPSRALYELSAAPTDAASHAYAVQKVRYRVVRSPASQGGGTGDEGEPLYIRSRLDHVYDFKPFWFQMVRHHVHIEGVGSQRRVYKEFLMSPGPTIASWTVGNVFQSRQGFLDTLRHGTDTKWLDQRDGRLVAVERRAARSGGAASSGSSDKDSGNGEGATTLPQLDVLVHLEEKDLDLLVTAWVARVWQEAVKDHKEPMTGGFYGGYS